MSASGFTPISLYFSATGAAVPLAANLVAGELALNTNDGKLYYKNSSGVVTLLAGATAGPAGGSTTQVQYNNAGVLAGITGATTNGTALTLVAPVLGTPASGIVTNLTGTASININGTVGATTANTGAFTTGTFSSTLGVTGTSTLGVVNAGTTSATSFVSSSGVGGADAGIFNSTAANGGRIIIQRSGSAIAYFGSSAGTSGVGSATDTDVYATGSLRLFAANQVTNYLTMGSGGAAVTGTLGVSGMVTQTYNANSGVAAFKAVQQSTGTSAYTFYNLVGNTTENAYMVLYPTTCTAAGASPGVNQSDNFSIQTDRAHMSLAAGDVRLYASNGSALVLTAAAAGVTIPVSLGVTGAGRFGGSAFGGAKLESVVTATGFGAQTSSQLHLGGATSVNDVAQITFGLTSAVQNQSAAAIGFITTSATGSTKGDLVFLTRNGTGDTAPTERMRIDSAGAVTIPGTLGVSTGAAVGGATPGAGGLAFPATAVAVADANTLDDYEEYTSASTACTGALLNSVIWRVVKVGQLVTFHSYEIYGTAQTGTNFTLGETLPAAYRPFRGTRLPIVNVIVNNASQANVGVLVVSSTTGVMTVYRDATLATSWGSAANTGIESAFSVSWLTT